LEWRHGKTSKKAEPLKTLQMIATLMLTLISVGCSGGTFISPKSSVDIELKNSSNNPPELLIGSKFIYQYLNPADGKSREVTMEIEERKEFEHKQAYWIKVTGKENSYFNIYDMNLNWIGLFGDGKELESIEPCLQILKWPLKIGEKWNSEYTFRDYSDASHGIYIYTSKVSVNIRTYEEVKVPAGVFKALRIQAGEATFWYAPSISWIVKVQTGFDRQTEILELVKYNIPIASQNQPYVEPGDFDLQAYSLLRFF
jgi:hypothetical protein